MARGALEASVAGRSPAALPQTPAARAKRGAFGCIGHARADRPLGELGREVTVAVARDEPRVAPVILDELQAVRIEISVLTEPRKLQPVLAERIVIGREGLLVRRRDASGILLPQVAPERRWGPDAFLAAACRKAGLAPDAWREPGTKVFTFQADVFGEPGDGGRGTEEG